MVEKRLSSGGQKYGAEMECKQAKALELEGPQGTDAGLQDRAGPRP